MSRCLGIHYRGTDKTQCKFKEAEHIDDNTFLSVIKKYLNKYKTNYDSIYIATDDPCMITKIQHYFKDDAIDIFFCPYEILQSVKNTDLTDRPLHKIYYNGNDQQKLDVAYSALFDTIMLSKTNCLLKMASQMSAFCKIINPLLEVYRINGCSYNWFPENQIKTLKI